MNRRKETLLRNTCRVLLSIILALSLLPLVAMPAFAEEDIDESNGGVLLMEDLSSEEKDEEPEDGTISNPESTEDEVQAEEPAVDVEIDEYGEEVVVELFAPFASTGFFMSIMPTSATTPPTSITGTFTLLDGWTTGSTPIYGFPGILEIPGQTVASFGRSPDEQNSLLHCLQTGAANWGDERNGNNRSGTVYATWQYNDTAAGLAWYKIDQVVAHHQPAPPGSDIGVQPLGGWLALRWDFDGVIELIKRSANPTITDGNSCYSLEGAEYGIYRSYADAINRINAIEVLITDADGYVQSEKLLYSTYYVREIVASPGYSVDDTVYTVMLNSTLYTLEVEEMPIGDPVRMIVQKLDVTTNEAWGKDDPAGQKLAGAQFTVRYYDGYYDTVEEAETSGAPTRTWIVETKENGIAWLRDSHLVAGSDALYVDSLGFYTIPLGTVLIQETKAPLGYRLPDPSPIDIQQIRFDTILQQVIRLNEIIIPNDPRELELIKVDGNTGEALPGAVFDLYRETSPGSNIWEFVIEKTTDNNGAFMVSPVEAGSYKLVEKIAPSGYLLPAAAGLAETFFTIDENEALTTVTIENYRIEILKTDKDTHAPVADTEFTILKYPVIISNGVITSNLSLITADDPAWVEIARTTTDSNGKAIFSGLPYGYYMLEETRPNPLYASYRESGGGDRFVVLDRYTTNEVQVFEDEIIQVSCEVYKKTIALTSSALDGTNEDTSSNVGGEEYLYRFGARSTSNVWVDEFIIVDDLSYVSSLGYRMTTLWTGTSPAGMDFDNKMAVLYKTNKTDPDEPVIFSYNPLSANPDNPNNPDREMVYSNESGWRIWAEELSTTTQVRLDVADLNLAEDEYIVALKIVYGGVVKGFYTGKGWQTEDDPHTIQAFQTVNLLEASLDEPMEDWWYAVVATQGLRSQDEMGNETIMKGSIQADIARNNGILTDSDTDAVETRVITPFSYPTMSLGLVGIPMSGNIPPSTGTGFPRTGDRWALPAICAAALLSGVALTATSMRRRRAA